MRGLSEEGVEACTRKALLNGPGVLLLWNTGHGEGGNANTGRRKRGDRAAKQQHCWGVLVLLRRPVLRSFLLRPIGIGVHGKVDRDVRIAMWENEESSFLYSPHHAHFLIGAAGEMHLEKW